ncbi:phospholipase effector Tle1 domain-containing protein [Marinobacter sp. JSM 1782161]|uniref:phospholipase effector Tle1 domain-containing protein n=1 Tax=Marinobacter sp. JSM 1782161 TaxID=2685906 RepID=UPI00140228A9|nr:DUF2235 domain-containing protein [Marinobacter sp. JSM 1782161]
MSKAIVVCCDGTWNQVGGKPAQPASSNVLKCVRGLKAHSGRRDQVVYYDDGLGNGGRLDRWLAGLFGNGMTASLLQAYRFIANNWAPSDDIYLLGFSRGAHCVRRLADFIHVMGLIGKSELHHLPDAHRWYRAESGAERSRLPRAALVEELRQSSRRIPVRFLGVFDTVGANGLPVPGLRRWSKDRIGFHDTHLSDSVSYAVQAMAIDECRTPFRPDLWTHSSSETSHQAATLSHHTLQVWLPGMHGDVGGVVTECGLSELALQFMIGQANQHGLEWQLGGIFSTDPDDRIAAPIGDSVSALYRLMGDYHRPIGAVQREAQGLAPAITEKLHVAAVERLEMGVPIHNRHNLERALAAETPIYHERRHLRLTVPESLSVADMPDVGEVCTLVDMSESGARLYYSGNGSVAAGGEVRLRHPRIGDRTARVRWCSGSEAGVEFAA